MVDIEKMDQCREFFEFQIKLYNDEDAFVDEMEQISFFTIDCDWLFKLTARITTINDMVDCISENDRGTTNLFEGIDGKPLTYELLRQQAVLINEGENKVIDSDDIRYSIVKCFATFDFESTKLIKQGMTTRKSKEMTYFTDYPTLKRAAKVLDTNFKSSIVSTPKGWAVTEYAIVEEVYDKKDEEWKFRRLTGDYSVLPTYIQDKETSQSIGR